jgi:peptidylprolyl isomerase domain and WD repeat-containing protein 1
MHATGMIEYWSATDYSLPQEAISFSYKLDTDLYTLARAKTVARSLEVSQDGSKFSTFSTDRLEWAGGSRNV